MSGLRGKDLLTLCKDALARSGEPHAELYASFRARGCARFSGGDLGQHMSLDEPMVVARVAHGNRVAEAQTSRLDLEAVTRALADASRAAHLVPETVGFPGFAGDEPLVASPERFTERTAAATEEERVEMLAPALARIAKAGLVSAGMLETTRQASAVATTAGCHRSHDGTVANFKVWALETAGGGGAAGYGSHLHRDVGALRILEETERAVDHCERGKNPLALDAGLYDVVFEPAAAAELLEWLSLIAFGAGEVEQGGSPMRLGESITGENITITEDPLDASDLGFCAPFDREGTPRRTVGLIEGGVARAILHDRSTAARMKATSTGSALPPDAGGGSAGSSAVHLAGGSATGIGELLSGMRRGLYVCRLHYVNGLLETPRAVMTGLTRDGCFLVENGKLTRAVGNLRFTDSFLEGLARCDGMTKERRALPTWWSDGGAVVAPAIRIRGFRFNGGSQVRPTLE